MAFFPVLICYGFWLYYPLNVLIIVLASPVPVPTYPSSGSGSFSSGSSTSRLTPTQVTQ